MELENVVEEESETVTVMTQEPPESASVRSKEAAIGTAMTPDVAVTVEPPNTENVTAPQPVCVTMAEYGGVKVSTWLMETARVNCADEPQPFSAQLYVA
jgi:hypothetical protein